MTRKHVAVLAALAAVILAVWFLLGRDRHSGASAPSHEPTSKLDLPKRAPKAAREESSAPRGMAPRWSLDIDPVGPLRLEGQVQDEDGQGVGAAEVWLDSVPPRSTKTEDDGTFAFDKLVGREYRLSAVAGELVGGPVEYKLTETSDPVVIRLTKAAKVVVTVRADDGKPIEGAVVRLAAMGERTARTAADGTTTLSPVHPGWVAVQVTADGYAPGQGFTQVGSPGATGRLSITLHHGVAVSGLVLDEHGRPIAKAHVAVAGIWDLTGGSEPVQTDAKGRFTFPALPPGTHTLVASDGEHAPARSAPVTVANRPVDNVTITMQAGGVLTGTVVDDAAKPVPFATVRVAGAGPQMWMIAARQATSDRTGHFELRGLARTKLKARAESDDAASQIADIDLTSTTKAEIELVLDVKGTIAGIVVDETEQPVPEVQVNAFPDIFGGDAPEGISLAGMSSATTDGAGHFTIRGLPDGSYRVRASRGSRGMFQWGQQGTPAKVGDKNVKIVLAADGSVVGKLALENGDAPKIATVQLGFLPGTPAAADGTFELAEVAPGTYDLHVRGAEFAEYVQRDVMVEPGKPTDLGTLRLVRGRKLTGRVVDAGGSPVPGAKVKLGNMLFSMQGAEDQMANIEELTGMHTTVTDQDGRFTLIGIAKKATSVLAEHPEHGRSNALEIPAGTDDPPPVTLALRGFGTLTGKVTLQGEPVPGATITATPQGGGAQVRIVQSGTDGTFTLTKLAEGTHVVSAIQQSGFGMSVKSTSTTVQVHAGKTTQVTIDIPVGKITLTVAIKPLPNQKVDGAQVFLFHGSVAFHNAKELTSGILGTGMPNIRVWSGANAPAPTFDQLVAGDYSVCSVPITGDMSDMSFQQRLQEHAEALEVYCKRVKLTPSPLKQVVIQELPAMKPLPSD